MSKFARVSMLAFTAVLTGSAAHAQSTGPVPLTEMNFDLWCQDEAKLPPARCDKRLPDDDARFDAYRKKIEDYEVPYLEQRDQNQHLNTVLLHNDPVDHPAPPTTPTGPSQANSPNSEDVPPK
jgi:hypothetical protein